MDCYLALTWKDLKTAGWECLMIKKGKCWGLTHDLFKHSWFQTKWLKPPVCLVQTHHWMCCPIEGSRRQALVKDCQPHKHTRAHKHTLINWSWLSWGELLTCIWTWMCWQSNALWCLISPDGGVEWVRQSLKKVGLDLRRECWKYSFWHGFTPTSFLFSSSVSWNTLLLYLSPLS